MVQSQGGAVGQGWDVLAELSVQKLMGCYDQGVLSHSWVQHSSANKNNNAVTCNCSMTSLCVFSIWFIFALICDSWYCRSAFSSVICRKEQVSWKKKQTPSPQTHPATENAFAEIA